ncbi:HTH-type transcriptional repressor NicS [Oxobacter pfennigii]|uniref:HTH-type transcriptional repressor NicS n=1 Tax=Oxobacter pfennigii TaxID=36849 RepID=A0A0P9AEP6_9CLOT|nr:TetR/AcrR family transcriptional regulator [Oxobacter pfennigii]KPU43790.1 HTH-type transcriptional repressor NicS [Oxobacter pfennigii]
MEPLENNESRERILNASIKLFSEKGFDATRVNEIAEAAEVNKALIYYYFKSKEEILDYLIDSLFKSVTSLAMDFIHQNIIQMIKEGSLDIEADRLHFINENALKFFLQQATIYIENLLDYVLEHRDVIRILLLESLKNGKHHDALFRLMDLLKENDDNLIYKTIWDADNDFNFPDNMILHKFFFSFMPYINFAAYFDEYKKKSSLNDQEIRRSFLHSLKAVTFFSISGNDILMLHRLW